MIPGLKSSVFSLHDVLLYLAIARKYLRLMVLLICFSLMCGLTFYIFARPLYHSTALIRVEDNSLPLDADKIYQDSRQQTIVTQLTAPHILDRTAHALGVNATGLELERKYLAKIKATFDSQSNLIIEIWGVTPELSDNWTEEMVRQFLNYRSEKRVEDRDNMEKSFSVEIKEVLTRIDRQFAERFNFQDERGFTEALIRLKSINSLPEDLSVLRARIDEMGRIRVRLQDSALQGDIVAKLSLIASAENKVNNLHVGQTIATDSKDKDENNGGKKEGDGSGRNVIVVPPMLPAQAWEGLLQQQQQVKAHIDELAKTYLPTSSKMAGPRKLLADIEDKLEAEYQTAQRRFDLEYQELINKKRDLEGKIPEYNAIQGKYQRLLSEIGIYDGKQLPFHMYLKQMQQRQEAVNFAGEKERINLQFSGLLETSDRSVSPNRLKLAFVSLLAGLALAIGVPFLIEYLDHTLGNLEQVESTFHMRGLGIIPQIDASAVGAAALINRDEGRKDALIENFRVIRTNVLSMGNLTKSPHVLMVTSAMPKEGKTVVSSNLAVSFAHTGARTLLIDTDLRRGRLHRLFGYRKDPGLSNVLLNEVTLEEACRPTGQENLTILSAGRHLDSGTELLGSAHFRELLQTLRERYDRIIIDTPPVLGLSETSMMQTLVDGVLFVIWTGRTPARTAKAAIDMLAANGANFYGFVLNRLDLHATANYYQYYYYSHDYYYQHPLENA